MAIASIDEAVRNIVCVGGDPRQTAILDNFCWPRVADSEHLGALVRACQACYDAAKAYGIPFISGKDSLNNEFALAAEDAGLARRLFKDGECKGGRLAIPYTLLISAIALVADVERTISSAPQVDQTGAGLFFVGVVDRSAPSLLTLAQLHRLVAERIAAGQIVAAHDCSEGGPLLAAVEMALTDDLSLSYEASASSDPLAEVFSGYVLQPRTDGAMKGFTEIAGVVVERIAEVRRANASRLEIRRGSAVESSEMQALRTAWQTPLDW